MLQVWQRVGVNLYHFTGGPALNWSHWARPATNGIRSVQIRDLMPLGAVWTPDEGTQDFDPDLFESSRL